MASARELSLGWRGRGERKRSKREEKKVKATSKIICLRQIWKV